MCDSLDYFQFPLLWSSVSLNRGSRIHFDRIDWRRRASVTFHFPPGFIHPSTLSLKSSSPDSLLITPSNIHQKCSGVGGKVCANVPGCLLQLLVAYLQSHAVTWGQNNVSKTNISEAWRIRGEPADWRYRPGGSLKSCVWPNTQRTTSSDLLQSK